MMRVFNRRNIVLALLLAVGCFILRRSLIHDDLAPQLKQMQSIRQVGILVYKYTEEHLGATPRSVEELKQWAVKSGYNLNKNDKMWGYYETDFTKSSDWILATSINDPYLVSAPQNISENGKALKLVYHKTPDGWFAEYVEVK